MQPLGKAAHQDGFFKAFFFSLPSLPSLCSQSDSQGFAFSALFSLIAGCRLSVCLSVIPHTLLALVLYCLAHVWVWHSGLLHYTPVELSSESTKTKFLPPDPCCHPGTHLVVSLLAPCFWVILGVLPLEWCVALANVPGSGPFHISSAFLGATFSCVEVGSSE